MGPLRNSKPHSLTENELGSLDIKSKTVFLYRQGKCVLIYKHNLRIERNHGFWTRHFPSVHRNLMSKDPRYIGSFLVAFGRKIDDFRTLMVGPVVARRVSQQPPYQFPNR